MRNVNARITGKDKNELIALLRRYASRGHEFELLLRDLLTPAEMHELVARLQIVKRLRNSETHREVCKELHVARQTVARGARALEEGAVLGKALQYR